MKTFCKREQLLRNKKLLGEPNRVIKFKRISETVYIYDNKTNNLPEWKFGVNKVGQIVWINHKPWSNPLVDRVEILPVTWKKYNCKKKPGLTKAFLMLLKTILFLNVRKARLGPITMSTEKSVL